MFDVNKVTDGFLRRFGETLIGHGYQIFPVSYKSKQPKKDFDWPNRKASSGALKKWMADYSSGSGIAVNAKETPAIDFDIRDEAVAAEMVEFAQELFGQSPVRIGLAPKALMMFKTSAPFRKMKSNTYEDEWGDKQEIEILGDGQYYILFGIHPDTAEPYRWLDGSSPYDISREDLVEIDLDLVQVLFNRFDELAKDRRWTLKRKSNSVATIDQGDDDVFAADVSKVDMPEDELRKRLLSIPGNEDHDTWFTIGMALYHQFDGADVGLHIWHEWSESAYNYDPDALDKRWESFDISDKGRAPTTARTIIKLAAEAVTTQLEQTKVELKDAFYAARDLAQWKKVCEKVRRAEIDMIDRDAIRVIACETYKSITGSALPVPQSRKMTQFEMTVSKSVPKWAQDWVFDSSSDRWYNIKSKIDMSITGFNLTFAKFGLSKKDIVEGKTRPSSTPTDMCLNFYGVEKIHGRRYVPGERELFTLNGLRVANTYSEAMIPAEIKELSPAHKNAIRRLKDHIENQFGPKGKLLLNSLAWVVQNPGKRLNWAVLLQGVEGDGKSYYGELLSAVMGADNVNTIVAKTLESDFTDWTVGQCVTIVEEPRLRGENRYEVINNIKTYITNPTISVHPKGKAVYKALNTTNYFFFTNFRDALPINEDVRRYLVLFSRFQGRDMLAKFLEEHPDYFNKLYGDLATNAGALRMFLVNMEIPRNFMSYVGGIAPDTPDRQRMIMGAKSEAALSVKDAIEESDSYDLSNELLNVTRLQEHFYNEDVDIGRTRSLSILLENEGFSRLGRFKIDGRNMKFWSKNPELFMIDDEVSPVRIRAFIKTGYPEELDI